MVSLSPNWVFTLLIAGSVSGAAAMNDDAPDPYAFGEGSCSGMDAWDPGMQMCMPLGMEGMSMHMLMLHGQIAAGETLEQGTRGRSALWSTSMVMADLGTTIGSTQYLNLDFMGTAEKWTLPDRGYPLLMQIGEEDAQGFPFLDSQHPHNSPIMGLTLSDTIRFDPDSKNHLKLSFAPRGETTDGPIAFMHRLTGIFNPDAPLGHHIGQDVGHVTSTVFAAAAQFGGTRMEASVFHGSEPHPENVDLPLGVPDSYALRWIEDFTPELTGMISAAYVRQPEPDAPEISFEARYSASLYSHRALGDDWIFHNSLIFGAVTKYDHAEMLSSFTEEWLFLGKAPRIWGRIEVLQRTSAELEIPVAGTANLGRWVAALTAGYTHKIASVDGMELGVGGSFTESLLPGDFQSAYGGGNPWSAKILIRLGGMKMWDL